MKTAIPGAAYLGAAFILTAFAASYAGNAGDILRSGSSTGVPPGAPAAPSASVPAVAAGTATDMLARTTQALQAVQAMQAAARAAAFAGPANLGADPNHPGQTLPNVPDGLTAGGLQLAGSDPALVQGAALPVQTTAGGQTTVTVVQTAQQALLSWQTFNIGKATVLDFDQTAGGADAGEWIAFNRVTDPSGRPSQILGSIQAAGQVYVINPNGIIFGGSSQVNVHALVASSLPINDNLVASGLLNNPDDQFLFTTLALPAGNSGTPAFNPPTPLTPDGNAGDVVTQPGALLSAPTTPDHVGGRIALIGADVTNGGTISTPDGQAILAAGQQVGLTAHDSTDPSLRGLDVYVGQGGGSATNAAGALIEAPRADVTLAGKSVDQEGIIDSSTSVSLNGRIDLLADYGAVSSGGYSGVSPFFPQNAGTVTFGPASVTQILPELSDTDRVVGTQLALPSQINVQGQAVHLAGGASILAPNANLEIDAGGWNFTGTGATAQDAFDYFGGQIYLDSGAVIDVSGSSGVAASVTENIVSVQLLGTELADSPLQQGGPLRGQTIQVDIRQSGTYNGQSWVGTPLADVSGYVALVQRTVGELTTAGGSVTLHAGGSVVVQTGATINVSGGSIAYQGGDVETTNLVSGGHIYNVSQATPDRVYDGIYTGPTTTDSKWGAVSTVTNPQLDSGYEAGYIQGGNGGTLSITAPAMALDGNLVGQTVAGPWQRTTPPAPGSLSLVFQGQDSSLPYNNFPAYSPTPPSIVFASGVTLAPADPFSLDVSGNAAPLRADRESEVVLAPALISAGNFGRLTIDDSDGAITVPDKVAVSAPAAGAIALTAATIDVEGSISAPGGSLNFTVLDISPYANRALTGGTVPVTPPPNPTRGTFTLGPDASLSTSGLLVDDRPTAAAPDSLPLETNGGSIGIKGYTVDLSAGSAVDVSGGLAISATGKLAYGAGGSIAIGAGQDPLVSSVLGGQLQLNAELRGYSGAKGGALSLLAPVVQIGGATAPAGTLLLSPAFFDQGGFASFSVDGIGAAGTAGQFVPGLTVAPGTVIAPTAQSWLEMTQAGASAVELTSSLLPAGVRPPVAIALGAVGARDPYNSAAPLVVRGDLVMGAGAVIRTDPGGAVALSGDTVAVMGSIYAPGGSITVSGGKDSTVLFQNSSQVLPTVDLGPASVLSAAGATVLTPDPRGYRTGSVLPGGTIQVSGNIVAEAGAILDVSGASDVLDLAPSYSGAVNGSTSGYLLIPTRVDSAGGSISLAGAEELFTDATLLGAAGGPSALGGSLSVTSGRFYPLGTSASSQTPLNVTLLVTQAGSTIPEPFYPSGKDAIGYPVLDAAGNPAAGDGHFAAASFLSGGFDSLTLAGTVQFSGPVSISANRSLAVASGGVIYGDSPVSLAAPYVELGTPFQAPVAPGQQTSAFQVQGQAFYFAPTFGAGSLTVSGSLIDIGNLSLQGIGQANIIADAGDVRGDGTLDVAGAIYMRAGQIYPPTETVFTIAAYDYRSGGASRSGSVTIAASGARPLPLSAGGTLNVFGSTITQGGALTAPLGAINLGWDGTGAAPTDLIAGKTLTLSATRQLTLTAGSTTSVSAIDPVTGAAATIPYGLNLDGTSWIDPAGTDITAAGLPAKAINLSAAVVADQAGATIDMRGGGDLYAYRWVSGTGGTNDVLAVSTSFAVIPGYSATYAPYGAYNTAPITTNLGSDAGYLNGKLAVGSQVYLQASNGLPAGVYTLLPARYALLPGAFLVTPVSGTPVSASAPQPDGSSIVSGYRLPGLDSSSIGQPLFSAFDVAPESVVRARAEYDDFSANAFFAQNASASGSAVPRLPADAGQLVLTATQAMTVQGAVSAQAMAGGLGGLVDIDSPVDILIAAPGASGPAGDLVLNAAELSGFGAESLLIGGVRQTTASGTSVAVSTANLTVDNAGAPLTGSDVILVADRTLTVVPGADIEQAGVLATAGETLLLGSSSAPASGDGALLRVSANAAAPISRAGVDNSTVPQLVIGTGAKISGASVTLDSTAGTTLNSGATVASSSLSVDSGQITLQLANGGAVPSSGGLVLSAAELQTLQAAQAVSLLSYSSIDIYGTGAVGGLSAAGQPVIGTLALHAGEIRGFNTLGGGVTFNAQSILLDNSPGAAGPGPAAAPAGSLTFNAGTIQIGANQLAVDQYANLTLSASGGILGRGEGGLSAEGALTLVTPLVTGATASNQSLSAGGAATLSSAAGATSTAVSGGIGAELSITGASVAVNSSIVIPGGTLSLHALSGDVTVGSSAPARLDVSGLGQAIYDVSTYTDGGQISLQADAGAVAIAAGSVVTVAAQPGGGNAGTASVSAPEGIFTLAGTLLGQGGAGGQAGGFSLDIGRIPGSGGLAALDSALDAGGFTLSRSIRVRTGDVTVDGLATAQTFALSADQGSILVTGTINAAGAEGGEIGLFASGSVTIASGAILTAAAQEFNDAGKGGSVALEAGSEISGNINRSATIDVQDGATIDLSVASATAQSASLGDLTGTLTLRAPQTADGTDLQVKALNGAVLGASSVVLEGFRVYDLSASGGAIGSAVEAAVLADGTAFAANTAAITQRLDGSGGIPASVLHVRPGAEIINPSGDLTLDSAWDLSSYRFGPSVNPLIAGSGEPGDLTLRAAGNLVFGAVTDPVTKATTLGSLSDGFGGTSSFGLWDAPPLAAGTQSWSYRLVAGADFGAADFRQVEPQAALAAGEGSLLLGDGSAPLPLKTSANRSIIVPNYFEVIRTGTGNITISTGRDVQILDPLATIYTAGTQIADPTTVVSAGDFALPNLSAPIRNSQLGSVQTPIYGAYYTFGGGDVTITAGGDIEHGLSSGSSIPTPDSSKELPDNWLYRRGYVNPTPGQFDSTHSGGEVESTSWWVDFSNFFEGVGALGGGNVTLIAGHDISNVDAVVPTNARMAQGTPSAANMVELGGGDLLVRAGHDISGGVYYVERGSGILSAGGDIQTNSTRAAMTQYNVVALQSQGSVPDPTTWLPTTLFLGQGSFDVTARGDLLLGPVANPFLLPQGANNNAYDKSYFSTYAPADAVTVASLTGTVTVKDNADGGAGSLTAWFQNVLLYDPAHSQTYASYSQPWLRLDETLAYPFTVASALMPPTLRVTAFSGDIDLVGSLLLSPSAQGTLDLLAAGSINGTQVNAETLFAGVPTNIWGSSLINLSDADPARIPGVSSPVSLSAPEALTPSVTPTDLLDGMDALFNESGSTEGIYGVIQTKQALHAPGPLHANDPTPLHLYAGSGSISGITLYAGKAGRVVAGDDITDVSLYLQNNTSSDVSVVAAGRDIIAYDPNSPLRVAAQAPGNQLLASNTSEPEPGTGNPTAGDIQIGGPGTLEVLAGRNLDLGVGPNASDGTAVGITSIGNARNPNLPFAGASVIAGAGIGGSSGLDASQLDFAAFTAQFLNPATGGAEAARYLPELGLLLGLPGASNAQIWSAYGSLPSSRRDSLALDIFYLVLRDAGRDHNISGSNGFRNYAAGFAAIAALFPGSRWNGEISLTSREIKTESGGDISLFTPGGALTVGIDLSGNQPVDQGILTEDGGNISIFTQDSVNVGTSRIFTLRGGNEIIWSSAGSIAAGASSKTVQSAPPTRVLIDPQSGDVKTDLAGLATGGGIGVLASVAGVPPGDVDLIAPVGTINAGDAGIRVSGNLNISALQVVNAGNIQVGGASAGTPVAAAPSLGGLIAAASTTAATASSAAAEVAKQEHAQVETEAPPSVITVEVVGYGGGDGISDANRLILGGSG